MATAPSLTASQPSSHWIAVDSSLQPPEGATEERAGGEPQEATATGDVGGEPPLIGRASASHPGGARVGLQACRETWRVREGQWWAQTRPRAKGIRFCRLFEEPNGWTIISEDTHCNLDLYNGRLLFRPDGHLFPLISFFIKCTPFLSFPLLLCVPFQVYRGKTWRSTDCSHGSPHHLPSSQLAVLWCIFFFFFTVHKPRWSCHRQLTSLLH